MMTTMNCSDRQIPTGAARVRRWRLLVATVLLTWTVALLSAQGPGTKQVGLEEARAAYDSKSEQLKDDEFGIAIRFPRQPQCMIVPDQTRLIGPPRIKSFDVTHDQIDFVLGNVALPSRMQNQIGRNVAADQAVEAMREKMLAARDRVRRIFKKNVKVGSVEGVEEVIVIRDAEAGGKKHDRVVMFALTLVTQKRLITAQATMGEADYKANEAGNKAKLIGFIRSLAVDEPGKASPAAGPGGTG